jgi:hypothetical protein
VMETGGRSADSVLMRKRWPSRLAT